MKKKILTSLIPIFLIISSNLIAQKNENSFQIKMYKDRSSLALESDKGNNWNTMFIKKKDFELNQNGMLYEKNISEEVADSKYVISIKRNRNKVTLTGIKGTNWKELTFQLPEKGNYIVVNENGKS
ncbi:hypothetical protein AAH994_14360 [Weeksellaceae bacterium A-14]